MKPLLWAAGIALAVSTAQPAEAQRRWLGFFWYHHATPSYPQYEDPQRYFPPHQAPADNPADEPDDPPASDTQVAEAVPMPDYDVAAFCHTHNKTPSDEARCVEQRYGFRDGTSRHWLEVTPAARAECITASKWADKVQ